MRGSAARLIKPHASIRNPVIITAPVAAVAAGMKEAFPALPAFGPGAELTGLLTRAQRDLGVGSKRPASADTAEAPAELAYIV